MAGLELIEVTPHVLCVRRPRYLSDSYIVHDAQGVVLIDAGMEADGRDMRAGLERIGAEVSDVRAILLTHWHNDHSSGAEALRAASGATAYHHRLEQPNFRRTAVRGVRAALSDWLPDHGAPAALKAVVGQSPPRALGEAVLVEGGERIEGRFLAVHTPGHTAGHLSFVHEPDGVLFAGDALAFCRGRLWFMSRFLTEDRAAARRSMRGLLDLPWQHLCPGHRGPLAHVSAVQRRALAEHLDAGRPWPLLS
jgi:glyoxylase-like metal-dependent hydrolase (beta-lactamase superfamily II)